MNIAIFGGSFDPPHIGHEKIVYESLDVLDIDKLIVIPTYLNPFKKSFKIEPADRLDLVKKLFEKLENVEVSSFEIDQNRAVYAIETVEYLKGLYNPNKIYLIIGADNLEKLHLWYKFDRLNDLVEFVIFKREGFKVKNGFKVLDSVNVDISSTNLRGELDIKFIPKTIKEKVKDIWLKD
eukprot:Anaeramoba_flamelloidesa828842_26.p1 GENE.a828842_26~~a828842_26.p1  ORF type:complete len:180 (-),score=12.55 a828842_26:474-1013(-)